MLQALVAVDTVVAEPMAVLSLSTAARSMLTVESRHTVPKTLVQASAEAGKATQAPCGSMEAPWWPLVGETRQLLAVDRKTRQLRDLLNSMVENS